MAEELFSTSSTLSINDILLDAAGALDGQSLVFDGTSFVPADIVPVGTIEMWAGTTAPNGWVLCDGGELPRSSRLFTVIGTTFGTGDGSTTFNVPNFQIKIPVGLTSGGTRGSTSISHTQANFAHNHAVSGNYDSSGQSDVQQHYHAANNPNTHSHTSSFENNAHYHGTAAPSNSHSHQNPYGTPTRAGNTSSSAHTGHNGISGVNANMGAHGHNLVSEATSHQHSLTATTTSHQHSSWNGLSIQSNEGSTSHSHTVNTQRIYFIIKS